MSTPNPERVLVDHRPATLSAIVAAIAAGTAVVMIAMQSILFAVLIGIAVLALFGVALLGGYRTPIEAGTLLLLFGFVVTGTFMSAPAGVLLVGFVATIVAWDVGENAISLGEQLVRNTATLRTEVGHIAATITVGALGGGLVYGVYRAAAGGRPLSALAFMLTGIVVVAWVFRK